MRWLDDVTHLVDMSFCQLQETVKDASVLPSMGSQRIRHDQVTEQQQRKERGGGETMKRE